MVKYDAFKSILKMEQKELKDFCKRMLEYYDYDITDGDGFLYGKGDVPIMLLAHLDTVHTNRPSEIYFDGEQGIMWSPQGIGGDDRCGVYTILRILKDYKPYVMFLEDEEIGGVGANKMVKVVDNPKVKFLIELDRRGRDDCVFYDCGNKDFQDYIQTFGFKLQYGTFTDICEISPEWDIASVNLSIGYNREHTISETINVNYMLETYQKVLNILADKDSKYYDYQEKTKFNWRDYYEKDYGDYYDNDYDDYEKSYQKNKSYRYEYSTIDEKSEESEESDKEYDKSMYDDIENDYIKDGIKGVKEREPKYCKRFHYGNKYDDNGYIDDDGYYITWEDSCEIYNNK